MCKYLQIIILLAFGFVSITARSEGYELKIRIKNFGGKEISFGHHLGDKLLPIATLKLDQLGIGTIKGSGKLPEGMYFFMTSKRTRFDFFLTNSQNFVIETDTTNLFNNLKFYNSPENTAAHHYLSSIVGLQREAQSIREKLKTQTDSIAIQKLNSRLIELASENTEKTNELIYQQRNNLVGAYIKANQNIVVPEPPRDAQGNIVDSMFQIRYYRTHFFDHMDLRDARLVRTPIYLEKVKEYIGKVIPQHPDTVYRECNKLLLKTESYTEVFRFLLVNLFEYYAESKIMGFDAVYVKLAENWVLTRAAVSDTSFMNNIEENIVRMKPMLIGKTAPDLRMLSLPSEHFIQAKTDSIVKKDQNIGSYKNLSEIDAKYTLLVFWECDCGHCKEQVPELYQIYQKLKHKGIEVYAVHMLAGTEGKQKWVDFVNEHELYDWINVWNPDDYSYKKIYVFNVTPSIFVLDKDKKILAKYLNPKMTEEFINTRIALDEKNSQKK